ncbi:protein of unknown function [Taphrina deformans PYCC 5710]|uniref:Uncharacterized protein n=1 Tax=Taphrina deformans (strain PYCC 5710 / ATCC 11124 / CBS 356.35 / IMI 108563 / JCM 9778 / NBRC 8474) TaxID=1097556 RepID=R4XL40_TAPDE|nr:protein of unknown function [Taphrina deformans PYCC 5710]|eukprot:CCG84029.1 protein of unknown function [Taphrina deformans PYCC 5710]
MAITWTKPDFKLPEPKFEFLLHLECDMEEFHMIGKGPHGKRATVIFKGGRFKGPKLQGRILPGGGDWEVIEDDSTAYLDTRYNLETDDGAVIYLQTTGVRQGPQDVLDRLGDDESITADQYSMRLSLKFECGDERYRWLNKLVCFAMSGRNGNMVIYDAYTLV